MSDLDHYLEHEEHWRGNERRQQRQERKIAQRTDRSKYRKSDQDAQARRPKRELPSELRRGQVVEIRGGDLFVLAQNARSASSGELQLCHIKGSFKAQRTRTKNLVAVGDWVRYWPAAIGQAAQVVEVEPRRSVLARADNLNHTKQQILAVNVDKLVIVFALCQPMLNLTLIDRYLIAAQQGNLEPILVLSKLDLLEEPSLSHSSRTDEQQKLQIALELYKPLGIPIICYRDDRPEMLEPLAQLLKGHTCVFSGPSGVGKSTLLAKLTGCDLRTQPVCRLTGRGSHTTSHAQLLPLQAGGYCVDTPGIRSFGLWQLDLESVNHYFDEIAELIGQCRFRDCKHCGEPGCRVTEALEAGQIAPQRYESYLSLIQELTDHHLRR